MALNDWIDKSNKSTTIYRSKKPKHIKDFMYLETIEMQHIGDKFTITITTIDKKTKKNKIITKQFKNKQQANIYIESYMDKN